MMSWTKKLKTYRINKGLVAFEAVVTFDRSLLVVSHDIVSINIYIFMMIKPLNKWLQVFYSRMGVALGDNFHRLIRGSTNWSF